MWLVSLWLETALFFTVIQVAEGRVTLTVNPTLPEEKQMASISCHFTKGDYTIQLNNTVMTTCNTEECLPTVNKDRSHTYSVSHGVATVTILSLDRNRDQGTWKCSSGEEDNIDLLVYIVSVSTGVTNMAFPSSLSLNYGGNTEVDLARSSVTLHCQTDTCTYPAPSMKWYYSDTTSLVKHPLYNATRTEVKVAGGSCAFPENIFTINLTLPLHTMWPDNSDKIATFSCGIEYLNSSRNLYSLASKGIRFAVGVSSVELEHNGQSLRNTSYLNVTSGETVTLICITGISRPDPTINWHIGGEKNISRTNNTFSFIPHNRDHGKEIFCGAYTLDPTKEVESGKFKLYVRVQVTEVKLQLNSQHVSNISLLNVTLNKTATLVCVPGTSRPDPVIEWFIGSDKKSSNISQFSFTPSYDDHDKLIYCRAYNTDPDRAVFSSQPKLYVKVEVTSVFLSVSTNFVFYEGYPEVLTCTSSPSRPIATITWRLGTRQLTNNIITTNTTDTTGLYTTISQINLTVMKNDLNQSISCDGFIDTQLPVSSSKHPVTVWYKPSTPNVIIDGNVHISFPWIENATGILQCYSSDHGNPISNVIWVSDKGNADSDGNLLIAGLTPNDNGKRVSCKLVNTFTTDKDLQIVSEPLTLDVEYYPIITYNVTSPIAVNETQSVSIMCESSGNPTPNVIRWKNRQDGNVLMFFNLSKQDTGTYTCEATATSRKYGTLTSQRQLDIIVQYAPVLRVLAPDNNMQNQTAVLVCEAHGVPAKNTFYPWVHIWGNEVIRTGLQGISNATQSTLTLDRLLLANKGKYICSASNGIIGNNGKFEQTGSEILYITGVPNILLENTSFAAEIDQSINISVPFYSDPAIKNFTIQKKTTTVGVSSHINIHLTRVAIDYVTYGKTVQLEAQTAHINFQNLSQSDFDNYTLVLMNPIGQREFTFQLIPYGPPLVVDKFYLNRCVGDQIELHFVPGFSGGPEQTFVIEYTSSTSLDDNAWQTTNVTNLTENGSPYKLPNGTFSVNITKPPSGIYLYRMHSWNVKGSSPFSANIKVIVASPKITTVVQDAQEQSAAAGGSVAVLFVIVVIAGIVISKKRTSFGKQFSDDQLQDMQVMNIRNLSHRRQEEIADFYENLPMRNDIADQNVYENAMANLRVGTDVYFDDEQVYENQFGVDRHLLINNDCLTYADLELAPPKTNQGKPIIHGLENRTDYAKIAFGLRGEPLPDSDDELG